ncbi:MAG: type II toxin-antitoxin system VapC family toxin [Planctomycetaceae bacterium]|jgi:PIN domain nuclease of toxin-antitoxin system|nr:type II toxin-antitoxin system VapC family toxin [Planctomycetaceae bacterium]
MKILLDTHTFIWLILDDPQLPVWLRKTIDDPQNAVYLSIVSIWELGIKIGAGKLELNPSLDILIEQALDNDIKILMIRPEHVYTMMTLPLHHRDPFDRMIIAHYNVQLLWNTTI